ncbi:PIR protein [Plasmodium ovale]|uniref:PIR protein n=1 Tax=Plasmodium ovale TaxID=36330 RepID=A0A1D3JE93_PLAOA|nr:PIR protein [Plasmodium ovale]
MLHFPKHDFIFIKIINIANLINAYFHTDGYENDLPANKFINKLKEEGNAKEYLGSNLIKTYIGDSAKQGTKNIGSMLIKNLLILKDKPENEWNKRCRDINHWLDLEKERHSRIYPIDHTAQWNLIEELWNETINDRLPKKKCKRNSNYENLRDMEKKYALDNFCENRDYLRMLCEQQISSNSGDNEKCSNLVDYVDKNYRAFFDNIKCLKDSITSPDNKYHVEDKCSLYNISGIFPEYSFENKQISEKVNTRKKIILCSEFDKLLSCHNEEDEIIHIEMTTPETSCSCPPTQNVLYGVLGFLGILSTFFFLYNFTSLGSWLQSRKIKKQTTRRGIDYQETYNLTDYSTNIISNDSENKGYYLTYKAT